MKREDFVQGKTYNIRMTNGGRRVDARYTYSRDVSFSGPRECWRHYFTSLSSGREVKLKSLLSVEELPTGIEQPCPYTGIAYSNVPGYVTGYGCPVCKAIGPSHLTINKPLADAGPLDHWPDKKEGG